MVSETDPPRPGAAAPDPPPPPPPELMPALARFERGDFRGARQELEALLARKPAPETASAGRELLARLAPDPWAVHLGLGTLVLLLLVAIVYVF
jgi:hypothetical protein